MAQATILVVDDDQDFLSLLASELSQIPGALIQTACNDREALSLLRQYRFTLIVSDWAIHSTTAPQMLRRADPLLIGKTPVLIVSGSEKIGPMQRLNSLKHLEPVSFILKRYGPTVITSLAEQILQPNDRAVEAQA
jgi:DNA-binding NtrC family response regulator